MACESISPVYTFTFVKNAPWPGPPPVAENVLSDAAYKSIMGFSSTIGLGDQSSSLVIDLSGIHGTPLDLAGRIVVFTCDGFSFGGMIKNVTHSYDSGGPKTKIDITDMKEALARYDVFINEWHGTTDRVRRAISPSLISTYTQKTGWNCKNVHRLIEGDSWGGSIYSNWGDVANPNNYGQYLPDIAACSVFGTATDGAVAQGNTTYFKIFQALANHGLSWYHTNGWPLHVAVGAIRNIANEIPYVGTSAKSLTLLELINNVCEEAGYDWTFHTPEGNNWIAMRFIDKKVNTVFGTIENRIESAKKDKKLLSYSLGTEFKTEKTRRVVIGSRVNYIKEMYFPNDWQPGGFENNGRAHTSAYVLGFNENNWPILGYTSDFNVPVNTRTLKSSLEATGYFGFFDSHMLKEVELLATGTLATWKLYGILNSNSLSRSCMNFLGIDWQTAYAKVSSSFGLDTYTVSQACVEAVKATTRKSVGELIYEEICYPWIKNLYDTYYGKYYMCLLPKPTCAYDLTGNLFRTGQFLGSGSSAFMMDEPTDSGWGDLDFNNVIGLTNWSLFQDSSGKTSCFCGIRKTDYMNRFMGPYNRSFVFDASALQGDFILGGPDHIYTKAEVDGRVFNFDNGNTMGILIKMPNMIPQRWSDPVGLANTMGLRMLDLLVGDARGVIPTYLGTENYSFANVFKETLAAGRFDRIAIPMKSNVLNYGPYLSHPRTSYWSDGGVELKQVEDLNPWSYGGVGNMNTAGNRLALDGLKTRTKYESGQMTVAETPQYALEGGSATDPLINSIVCRFDAGGATTTYNYETYTKKFGQSAEAFNNYTKLQVSSRRANYNIVKDLNLQIVRAFSEGMRAFGSIREKFFEQASQPLSASSSSENSLMISSYPEQYSNRGYRASTGTDKKYGSDYWQDGANYEKYSVVSMDMIYTPVVANPSYSSSYMGSMAGTYGIANWPKNRPVPMQPVFCTLSNPLSPQGIGAIGNVHLNPYTTVGMMNSMWDGRGMSYGFRTEYVTFGSVPANTFAANEDQESFRDNQEEIRGVAMRGPLLLQSWGYDTNNKPVPNIIDELGTDGHYEYEGTQSMFATNWLANPQSWPCGPIDLRWDRERGVWVSPPSERLVVAELIEELPILGTARAKLIDYNSVNYYSNSYADDLGNKLNDNLSQAIVYINDLVGRPANSGSRVVAYHWGPTADYIALMIADTYLKVAGVSSCCTDINRTDPSDPCYLDPSDDASDPRYQGLATPADGYMVEGWTPPGFATPDGGTRKCLYDLRGVVASPGLSVSADNGQMQVLGYQGVNAYGFPCLTGIPIVDCTGEYPGGGDDPLNPI